MCGVRSEIPVCGSPVPVVRGRGHVSVGEVRVIGACYESLPSFLGGRFTGPTAFVSCPSQPDPLLSQKLSLQLTSVFSLCVSPRQTGMFGCTLFVGVQVVIPFSTLSLGDRSLPYFTSETPTKVPPKLLDPLYK